MEITKETLEERIEILNGQREQLVSQVNFVLGAIGTLRQLVKELETGDAVDDEG